VHQHVVPERILGADSHVVGNDVDDHSHVMRLELGAQRAEVVFGAELGIEARRIHHVVAVHAAAARRENGRAVDV
jgi:hypothetical protein